MAKPESHHEDLTMNKLEKIARDLAAVLSPDGEADWPRYLNMAEQVGSRLFRQFAEIMTPEAGPVAGRRDRPEAHFGP
jgi:hypothetical protein